MIIPIRILSVAWLFPIISLAMTLPFATNVTGHASLTKRMISTVTTLLSETLAADLQTIFVQSHALKLAATPLLAELTTSLGNLAGNLENVHDATAFISLLKSRYTTLGKVSFEILLEPVKISSGKIQDVHIAAKGAQMFKEVGDKRGGELINEILPEQEARIVAGAKIQRLRAEHYTAMHTGLASMNVRLPQSRRELGDMEVLADSTSKDYKEVLDEQARPALRETMEGKLIGSYIHQWMLKLRKFDVSLDETESPDVTIMRLFRDANLREQSLIKARRSQESSERSRLQAAIEVVRTQLGPEQEQDRKLYDEWHNSMTVDHQTISINTPLLGARTGNIQDGSESTTSLTGSQICSAQSNTNVYHQIPGGGGAMLDNVVRRGPLPGAGVQTQSPATSTNTRSFWHSETCCDCCGCRISNLGCYGAMIYGCYKVYDYYSNLDDKSG